ncbi:MAG: MFS transporter [Propionibacteriaceae bacterium]|jgi:EmrB/QacA subfamily drug resistance transporter|nr:MFS transporter [Propionibacteriaceae bacterium]
MYVETDETPARMGDPGQGAPFTGAAQNSAKAVAKPVDAAVPTGGPAESGRAVGPAAQAQAAGAGKLTEIRELSHSEILTVLSGLLLALFVSNVSGTVVSNALPTIAASIGATQQEYTWIVTAALLASTASTPVWGKLADLFHKKLLLMVGLTIFAAGSLASGASWSAGSLIASRALQGIGLGALVSLVQAIIGSIIPPRQRGRYMAYTGATMAIATVVGPLVGGFIVDQPWLGWRWCFWSAIPFTIIAIIVLKLRLHVPYLRRDDVRVDWLGSVLITLAVSSLLIWVSFAGNEFEWNSWQTWALVSGAVASAVAFVFVESRARNPIIPLPILTMRTTALACVASIAVGVGMFGAGVFLGQYYQLARGYSPTEAGLMTLPMMAGVMVSSLFVGRLVSRLGVWKPFVLAGAAILGVGFLLLATTTETSSLWLLGIYMTIAGLGVGMTMQNLVLAVQNSISMRDVGAASATVTFFRNLGGAVGIQVLGVVFSNQIASRIAGPIQAVIAKMIAAKQITAAQAQALMAQAGAGGSLDLAKLPDPIAQIIREAYGNSVGALFAIGAGLTLVSLVAVLFMRGTRLRDKFDLS